MTRLTFACARPATVLAVALLLVAPGVALAHAELATSDPAPGAEIEVVPDEIVLTFTLELVPSKSGFVLEGPDGEVGRGVVDAATPTTIVLDVDTLAPGAYEVRWTAVADDGHEEVERDTFTFTVLEPAPTPTPTPEPTAASSASASAVPTASPTPTPAPSPDPSATDGGGAAVLLPILVALAVLGGLAVWLVRRGRAA